MPPRMTLPLVLAVAAAAAALPLGTAAAASPTFRMTILHYVHGCHVWQTTKVLGPRARITLKRGTRLEIKPACPMDFEFAQVAGPPLALGDPRTIGGSLRVVVFRKPGVYRLTARNLQSSEQQGLQTLGPDNLLTLTVVVR